MSTVVAQELAELRRERDAAVAELRARTAELAQRDTDYRERAAHQSATSDVIKAMVLSPADPQPVFDLIVQRARALLDVAAVTLYECKGHQVYLSASDGGSTMFGSAAWEAYQRGWPKVPDRGSLTCRAILDGTLIHVRDMTAEAGISQVVRDLGHKTQVSIPFMRDGRAIGAIATGSPRVNGISDAQIQLLQTFAEQAVIAITSAETYRALQERTQALGRRNSEYEERIEQQNATIDVLKAMSASPGDAHPVFKLIVDRARAFCEADHATTALLRDGMLHLQAFSGMSADNVREYISRFPRPVDLSTLFWRGKPCRRRTYRLIQRSLRARSLPSRTFTLSLACHCSGGVSR
jgi:GAF domain-containing protein